MVRQEPGTCDGNHKDFIQQISACTLLIVFDVQIEGMFDPSPEIKKTERVAAKFSSAEQEAELRKKELTSLKQSSRLV